MAYYTAILGPSSCCSHQTDKCLTLLGHTTPYVPHRSHASQMDGLGAPKTDKYMTKDHT